MPYECYAHHEGNEHYECYERNERYETYKLYENYKSTCDNLIFEFFKLVRYDEC